MTAETGRLGPHPLQRFAPYPEYRDSGVEWLGDAPAHWKVKRLGTTVTGCQNGVWGEEPDGLHDTICVRVADFDRTRFRVKLDTPTLRSIGPQLFRSRRLVHGDLLLEKSGGGDKQPVGAVVLYQHDRPSVCSNFVARMPVADDHWPRYLAYLHAALYAAKINTRSIKQSTGIQNLDSSSYLNESVGLPGLSEQRAIADFLDRETARIDALVAKKERLIKLLQEKRTALITRAVTRGLDSNVPTKDSGVEWLGEIPAHWEVKRLGTTVTGCQNGVWGEEPDGRYDTICVRVADFDRTRFRVKLDTPTLRSVGPQLSRSRRLVHGDLLLEKSGGGDKQPVGAVVLYQHDRPSVCSNFVARMPVADDHWPRYLAYLHAALYAAKINTRSIKQSTGIQNLDSSSYLNELVGLPGLSEQRAIEDFLNRETAGIDALTAKIREAIDYLNEFRTALISAAVTGRIDVREAASP